MVQIIGKPINQVSETTQTNNNFFNKLILNIQQHFLLYLIVAIGLIGIYYFLNRKIKEKNDVLLKRYNKAISECIENGYKGYLYFNWRYLSYIGKPIYLINNDNLEFIGYYLGHRYTKEYYDLLLINFKFYGMKRIYKIIRFPIDRKDLYKKYLFDKPNGIFINAVSINLKDDYFYTPLFVDKDNKIINFRDKYLNDLKNDIDEISLIELLKNQKNIVEKAININPDLLSKKRLTDVELELKRMERENSYRNIRN